MKGVLYIRDKTGNFIPIPAIKGAKGDKGDAGESAYTVAVANGYEGTEEEFNNALANLAEAVNAAFDASDRVGDVEAVLDGHTTDLNNPHKVTAEQVGAVKKSGDTVNGNLNVNGALAVERSDNERKARTVVHNNDQKEIDLQNYTDDSNYAGIRLATEAMGAGDAAKLVHMKNGSFASFTLLHTGNKEKIFTAGTTDLTAGVSSLATGALYFVYE